MNRLKLSIIILFILFISFYVSASGNGALVSTKEGQDTTNLISMDFQDANLKTVLKIFSQQAGLNFVANQDVQDRTVTIYFDMVTIEDALNYLMNANKLEYIQEPGSNIFIVKESGKPLVETITKIYELKYAQLSPSPTQGSGSGEALDADILSIVKGLLSENGNVIADKRSNSLIIKDIPNQFTLIDDVLSKLDILTPQVMIEAEIIEASTAFTNRLGLDWSGTFGVYTGPGSASYSIIPSRGKFGREEGANVSSAISFSGMTATLNALLNDTDTKVLARPKILTMNNEVAKIELSSQEIARETTETSTANNVTTSGVTYEEKQTGVFLEVTPQISKDGYITMHLKPEVTTLSTSRYTDQYDSHTRTTETTVRVKDGETVVIGGLIKTVNTHGFKKVPFLGDIPILGWAFRYKNLEDTDKELIVFITPHIVKDVSYALADTSDREQEMPDTLGGREKIIKDILNFLGARDEKVKK